MQPEPGSTRSGGDARGSGTAIPIANAAVAAAQVRSRPSRERQVPRPALGAGSRWPFGSALELHPSDADAEAQPLRITVINGDLKFVWHPLMVGHYTSSSVTGTEAVVDRLIGGTMSESLALRQYPDAPGTHQFFANTGVHNDNPLQLPRPECVVVIGLGAEGNLRSSELAYTVQMGALALAQRLFEQSNEVPAACELAATLIGSGGAGISAGHAAQAIAQGVRDADVALAELNARLDAAGRASAHRRRWPRIGHLYLIELYLDRASEAWRALYAQAESAPGRWRLDDAMASGMGAMRRPLEGGYRGTASDYLRATAALLPSGEAVLEYTADTKKRARTERLLQPVQERLLRDLVAQASNDLNTDPQIGRTLFNLLVPLELEPFLGGTTEMLLQVDRATAGMPWELLDTDGDARRVTGRTEGPRTATPPWAIRAKLIRTLTTVDHRRGVIDARPDADVLVIGEPQCDPVLYPRLPGARTEAKAVHDLMAKPGASLAGTVVGLYADDAITAGPDARTVINALMSRNWRIVHIAGHGEAPNDQSRGAGEPRHGVDAWGGNATAAPASALARAKNARGVVLSSGTFLGPCEIRSMRVVPELVFVNCCHLAGRSAAQTMDATTNFDRTRFASGVAEALIEAGVRCVVAAGWAVDDDAALHFATRFYAALLRGARFIDAVAEARTAAFAQGGNTWAAYQCYGDPNWTLNASVGAAPRSAPTLADEFASVMSAPALALVLETLAIECEHQARDKERQRAKIRHLEAQFAPRWGGMGAVAEAFGVAWNAAGDTDSAIAWCARALAANDGSASLKASEQWGHLRVRKAWQSVDTAASTRRARTELVAALKLLNQLVALQPTMERHSLCGSAYKRLAMVERVAGNSAAAETALRMMLRAYAAAEHLGRDAGLPDWYYPALNRLAGEIALATSQAPGRPAKAWRAPKRCAAVQQALVAKTLDDPDFFSVVGLSEWRMLQAIAQGSLSLACAGIVAEFDALHARVPSAVKWKTVADQLGFVLAGVLVHGALAERRAASALIGHVEAYGNAPP